MNLKDFKTKHSSIIGIDKLKEKQNQNLLLILDALFNEMKSSGCTQMNVYSVENENKVMVGNCDKISDGIISKYNSYYSKYGLNFRRNGNYFELIVSPQPQATTNNTTNTNTNTSKDIYNTNLYKTVTTGLFKESLNEEINKIKKLLNYENKLSS